MPQFVLVQDTPPLVDAAIWLVRWRHRHFSLVDANLAFWLVRWRHRHSFMGRWKWSNLIGPVTRSTLLYWRMPTNEAIGPVNSYQMLLVVGWLVGRLHLKTNQVRGKNFEIICWVPIEELSNRKFLLAEHWPIGRWQWLRRGIVAQQ